MSKEQYLENQGRINARRGESSGSTLSQRLTSSLKSDQIRAEGYEDEKLQMEREKERDRRNDD